MATKIDVDRPDDLLNLRIEAVNLRVDPAEPDTPVLVVEDRQQPAFLIVNFPPQTIAERAYFEAAIVKPPVDPNQPKAITPVGHPSWNLTRSSIWASRPSSKQTRAGSSFTAASRNPSNSTAPRRQGPPSSAGSSTTFA